MTEEAALDPWAAWLFNRRPGGGAEELSRTHDRLAKVRDRVLANARLTPGETLLDVGTGDGLIAFGALDQVGPSGTVIFSDISQALLDHDRTRAEQVGVVGRCRFVRAAAEELAPIADASVDVVTTRYVLAYVGPKRRAFAEFARVLRPGGRISLYESVHRYVAQEPPDRFRGYDVTPVQDLAARVGASYVCRHPAASDPMFDFDERDLLDLAEWAGFGERHLELRIDSARHRPQRWDTFVRIAINPLAPTLEEAMAEALTLAEAERFVAYLRPLVERGEGTSTVAVAYVWAVKG